MKKIYEYIGYNYYLLNLSSSIAQATLFVTDGEEELHEMPVVVCSVNLDREGLDSIYRVQTLSDFSFANRELTYQGLLEAINKIKRCM